MIDQITVELKRTNLTLRELGHHIARRSNLDIDPFIPRSLIAGHSLELMRDHLAPILDALRTLPDADPSTVSSTHSKTRKRIPITPEMRSQLEREFERTGMTIKDLARRVARPNDAEQLRQRLRLWRSGQVKTIFEDDWLAAIHELKNSLNSNI